MYLNSNDVAKVIPVSVTLALSQRPKCRYLSFKISQQQQNAKDQTKHDQRNDFPKNKGGFIWKRSKEILQGVK